MAAALVRYVSPFGSPASMSSEAAERYLAEDERLWRLLAELGMLTEQQARVGPPRLDDPVFRFADLPEWREPDDADPFHPFGLVRELVAEAESRARAAGERFVVAERDGRFAAFPQRLLIDGDDVRWETT